MAATNNPGIRKPRPSKSRPWSRRNGPFRFTVKQFCKLDELGFFDDRKVELIRGMVYEMTTIPDHAYSTQATGAILRLIFCAG